MTVEGKKFWRVLFMVDRASTMQGMLRWMWIDIINRYSESVTLVSLDDMTAADLIELPADCMIVDGRARDLTGISMLMTQAGQRMLPTLLLYDAHWTPDDIAVARHAIYGATLQPYTNDNFTQVLEDFLQSTPPHDHRKEYAETPWLPRPRSVTLEQIRRAVAETGSGPYGMIWQG